jgi:hypothetical protein
MIVEIGKMYLVKDFFWILFPTKKFAMIWSDAARWETREQALWACERYNVDVSVFEPNTCIVLLEIEYDAVLRGRARRRVFYKLLDSNGNIGWICSDVFYEHISQSEE